MSQSHGMTRRVKGIVGHIAALEMPGADLQLSNHLPREQHPRSGAGRHAALSSQW